MVNNYISHSRMCPVYLGVYLAVSKANTALKRHCSQSFKKLVYRKDGFEKWSYVTVLPGGGKGTAAKGGVNKSREIWNGCGKRDF